MNAFYEAYGENVFNDFYEWLKENESIFDTVVLEWDVLWDYSNIDRINFYPSFYYGWTQFTLKTLADIKQEIYIGIDAGKYYLETYKGKNIDELYLKVSGVKTVYLYNSQGELIETISNPETVSLKDVSIIKLDAGLVKQFEIVGYA